MQGRRRSNLQSPVSLACSDHHVFLGSCNVGSWTLDPLESRLQLPIATLASPIVDSCVHEFCQKQAPLGVYQSLAIELFESCQSEVSVVKPARHVIEIRRPDLSSLTPTPNAALLPDPTQCRRDTIRLNTSAYLSVLIVLSVSAPTVSLVSRYSCQLWLQQFGRTSAIVYRRICGLAPIPACIIRHP